MPEEDIEHMFYENNHPEFLRPSFDEQTGLTEEDVSRLAEDQRSDFNPTDTDPDEREKD